MADSPAFLSRSVSLVLTKLRPSYYILIKSCLRQNWVLVKVEPNGALRFSFTKGRDVFASESDALSFLKTYHGPIEVVATGQHVLGYLVIGCTGLLLITEKVRTSAVLPGNHAVISVSSSKWYRIPLQERDTVSNGSTSSPVKDDQPKGLDKLTTFPVDGVHYFCETLDLTRPFPSSRPVTQPCWEFVWNRWLSTSWRSIGLDHVCPPLLQGLCEVRSLSDFDEAPYHYALVSRRGRLHVGPRYKARGLNEMAEPGNEMECEQIIWRLPAHSDKGSPGPGRVPEVQWSRYTWRRGSVPLWWGVKIKNNGIGEAEIKIQPTCTFKGSRRYARRMQMRYTPDPHLDPDDTPEATFRDRSLQVPLVYVSLLRKGNIEKDRSETKLASAFDAMVGALRKEHRLPLTYIALDWHEMDKQLGHEGIVEGFWGQVRDVLPKHGFALGTMIRTGPDHTDLTSLREDDGCSHRDASGPLPRCHSSAGRGWEVRWYRQQRGVMRYNCADSLDRTNVSSFFAAIQVMVEQCRELDIAIALSPKGVNGVAAMIRNNSQTMGPSGASAAAAAASRPGTPSSARSSDASAGVGGKASAGITSSASGGMTAIKEMGKELNKGFLNLVQDLKPQRNGAAATALPRSTVDAVTTPSDVCVMHSIPGAGKLPVHGLVTSFSRSSASETTGAAGQPPLQGRSSFEAHEHESMLEAASPLPPGWEAKIESCSNRIFYVDHNTQTTSWERPGTPHQHHDQDRYPEGQPPGAATAELARHRPATTHCPVSISPSSASGSGPLPAPSARARIIIPSPSAGELLRSSLPSPSPAGEPPRSSLLLSVEPQRHLSRLSSVDHRTRSSGWSLLSAPPCSPDLATATSSLAPCFETAALRPSPSLESASTLSPVMRSSLSGGVPGAVSAAHKWEPLSPWCMLRGDAGDCRRFASRINPEALTAAAELFLVNGDLSAWLYTGSQALHSERLLIFEPPESKLRKSGVGHYDGLLVALKRRFNNVWVDTDKQMQMDSFLGLKPKECFPNTYLGYKEDLVIPLDYDESPDEADPVGMMGWAAHEKQSSDGAGSGGGAGAAGSGGSFAASRRYTSTELIGNLAVGGGKPADITLNALLPQGDPAPTDGERRSDHFGARFRQQLSGAFGSDPAPLRGNLPLASVLASNVCVDTPRTAPTSPCGGSDSGPPAALNGSLAARDAGRCASACDLNTMTHHITGLAVGNEASKLDTLGRAHLDLNAVTGALRSGFNRLKEPMQLKRWT